MNIVSVDIAFIFCIYNKVIFFSVKIGITRKFMFCQIYSSYSFFIIGVFESLLCKDRGKIFFP